MALGAAAAAVVAAVWLVPRLDVPTHFWLSQIETVTVADRELRVVHVGYAQGLRQVSSLGRLDGALFELDHPAPPSAGMAMYDVLLPLDVVFFDSDGRYVDKFSMATCADECRAYFPSRESQFAIEAPAGSPDWVPRDAVLTR